ncbi:MULTISPECIES: ABC transporter permease [Mycolicibacterium]|jgi:sulfonate transport system permease protein|uniref:Nitrate/sulfonate/bicarbonate ABC transporter inner membrane protein n=2 Tax=Mycolicibacterium TaxID=1866885 RepID=A0A378TMC4_9MYCO|nr:MULTISPECIES: ABC transporter permease subunit [Mycolicibacterium]ANW66184.1 nitrate ABC transporter permease [Mycobacterium sp. djl-10]MCV7184141.1 ABC transporter permease subunit [Mycolicibacterium murale]STZ61013.1 nitrate/sulfonate/bicarbonate ABC transporter inner membrane protein [Mycolicibacterium tokaiense]BBY84479.1 ABC nitrate/sulfonate/bicarbonate family protein transporter inner membrane subunit [Mycolicibacterium tokaiense]GFG57894.1 ABC nitrate/sulfonate/bicarbonate family pr
MTTLTRQVKAQGSSAVAIIASVLSILAVWQIAVVVGNRVPSAALTVERLAGEAAAGELWHNLALSANRFALGLVLALVVGTALGVLMGMSKLADLAFSDLNAAGLAIPAVIWALLTTMWFGFGWLTPVVTVFLSGLPFVVVNIAKATRAVPAELVLMARSFGVPSSYILRHIVAPAVAGSTVAAVRFAIMSAWNGLLLAEWFGSTSGVGWRSRYWYDANQLDGFFAWVLVFILVLVIADLLILGPIEKYATRWRTV